MLSNRADAAAFERARAHGVPAEVLPDPADGADWLARLARYRVDLLVLAGYLKLVPAAVIARYRDRILNVHPALLPASAAAGCTATMSTRPSSRAGRARAAPPCTWWTRCTTAAGSWPRRRVPVLPGDTPEYARRARARASSIGCCRPSCWRPPRPASPVPLPETVESTS